MLVPGWLLVHLDEVIGSTLLTHLNPLILGIDKRVDGRLGCAISDPKLKSDYSFELISVK